MRRVYTSEPPKMNGKQDVINRLNFKYGIVTAISNFYWKIKTKVCKFPKITWEILRKSGTSKNTVDRCRLFLQEKFPKLSVKSDTVFNKKLEFIRHSKKTVIGSPATGLVHPTFLLVQFPGFEQVLTVIFSLHIFFFDHEATDIHVWFYLFIF